MARTGEVYRGLSIIGQAPLEGCEAPPSPLSFGPLPVVLWRIKLLEVNLCLGLSIVGYLIPVWTLAIVYSRVVKSLSWSIFVLASAFYSLAKV